MLDFPADLRELKYRRFTQNYKRKNQRNQRENPRSSAGRISAIINYSLF